MYITKSWLKTRKKRKDRNQRSYKCPSKNGLEMEFIALSPPLPVVPAPLPVKCSLSKNVAHLTVADILCLWLPVTTVSDSHSTTAKEDTYVHMLTVFGCIAVHDE